MRGLNISIIKFANIQILLNKKRIFIKRKKLVFFKSKRKNILTFINDFYIVDKSDYKQ
jgi:hypothetical protein